MEGFHRASQALAAQTWKWTMLQAQGLLQIASGNLAAAFGSPCTAQRYWDERDSSNQLPP